MYYIRFLKTPKFELPTGILRALITVTTDLGDGFYPADLTLCAGIVTAEHEDERYTKWQKVQWKVGMRAAWVEMRAQSAATGLHRLVVSTRQSLMPDKIQLDGMPEILSARSDLFGCGAGWEHVKAGCRVERRFRMQSGLESTIYEDTGDSIARHIWDAGVAMTAYLDCIMSQADSSSALVALLKRSLLERPRVIELGSGCGIVGLHLAQCCPTSDVLLTDLAEGMDILEHNIRNTQSTSKIHKIASTILDWENDMPEAICRKNFDIVIVSDCTYNSDSIPALVKTIEALTLTSPSALLIVAMKMRHESEAIFHELIANAGLEEVDCVTVPLPDNTRQITEQRLEEVVIYTYRAQAFRENDEKSLLEPP